MAVAVLFDAETLPQDHRVWTVIAEAVLGAKNACVLARLTPDGWNITIQGYDRKQASTLVHPHVDGDFEMELRRALRAAGVRVTGL